MKISDNYIITTDGSRNIMLNQRIYKPIYEKLTAINKDGEEEIKSVKIGEERTDNFKVIGYYSNLEHLFNTIVDRQLIEDGMEDLGKVMEVLKDVRENIKDVVFQRHDELYKVKKKINGNEEEINED